MFEIVTAHCALGGRRPWQGDMCRHLPGVITGVEKCTRAYSREVDREEDYLALFDLNAT
jgi:hypothetical protein